MTAISAEVRRLNLNFFGHVGVNGLNSPAVAPWINNVGAVVHNAGTTTVGHAIRIEAVTSQAALGTDSIDPLNAGPTAHVWSDAYTGKNLHQHHGIAAFQCDLVEIFASKHCGALP